MKKILRTACLGLGLTMASVAVGQTAAEAPLAIRASNPSLKWGSCPPIFSGDCAIAVLHGDPARPNADVFLRIGAGTAMPTHSHTSAERMILVSGKLRVHYRGAARTILLPGDYAYGSARLAHSATCIAKQRCVLFIAFEGPVDALPESESLD